MTKRIYFLPHAGAIGSNYFIYRNALVQAGFEVILHDYCGHGSRYADPFSPSLQDEARNFADLYRTSLMQDEYAIFGHSLGASIAYEIRLLIQNDGLPPPRIMYLSSGVPPYCYAGEKKLSGIDKKSFDDYLIKSGITPKSVLENKDLYDFFIPILRKDFALLETYTGSRYSVNQKARILQGTEENIAEIKEWSSIFDITGNSTYPGGHYYILDPQNVLKVAQLIISDFSC